MDLLQALVFARAPLPPPSGLISGEATDLEGVRLLSEEEAQKIAQEDNAALEEARIPPRPPPNNAGTIVQKAENAESGDRESGS